MRTYFPKCITFGWKCFYFEIELDAISVFNVPYMAIEILAELIECSKWLLICYMIILSDNLVIKHSFSQPSYFKCPVNGIKQTCQKVSCSVNNYIILHIRNNCSSFFFFIAISFLSLFSLPYVNGHFQFLFGSE